MNIIEIVDHIGLAIDILGIAVMVGGGVAVSADFISRLRKGSSFKDLYIPYRHGIGRSIILGLEFLVAGDLIRTVAVQPTYYSVLILAMIVGIRTFLGVILSMEIEGRWPWQGGPLRERRTTARGG
ncbi:MAG TPA: DUF1622 domain-containing protein [Atribacteraceae bacterium]|nr:DUF1622 domain-containing protein [Atribacteraceae bacterium]